MDAATSHFVKEGAGILLPSEKKDLVRKTNSSGDKNFS
jgi:hypothetical protein